MISKSDILEKCKSHIESLLENEGSAGLEETSYPSHSLNFLKRLQGIPCSNEEVTQHIYTPHDRSKVPTIAKVKLKIIVVGAGLGGLATAVALRRRGHEVSVFEKAPELGEVGAGIQVPPNSSRLLLQWGLGPYLEGKAMEPEAIRIRRWESGELISITKLCPEFQELYGAPYFVVHRANFQLAMYELAVSLGINIRVNAGVKEYHSESPSVTLWNGEKHSADFIVAADGVKSEARKIVLGGKDQPPQQRGSAAYRAMVDTEVMRNDPELAWLLDIPGQNVWIGEERHVMSYSIAGGKSFNMVFAHPENLDPSTWNQKTVIEDMKKHFEGWDPCLVKLISMIEKTLKWPLLCGKPLDNWLSPSGRLIIIGDAAHAMVPYMSQGAAMAVEDGAALAEILSLIDSLSDLRPALELFQRQRILRTGQMQEASLVNGKIWHFPDGPEQEARDAAMRSGLDGHSTKDNPVQWGDPLTASWTYGYDAEAEIRGAWAKHQSMNLGEDVA